MMLSQGVPAPCLFSSRGPLILTHQPLPSHPEPRPSPRLLSDLSHGRHQSSATDQGSRNRAAPSWHEGATAGARIQQNISVTPGCPWCGLQGALFPARIKDGSGCRNHSPRATDNLLCSPCRAPHLPSAHTKLTQESYSYAVTCHIGEALRAGPTVIKYLRESQRTTTPRHGGTPAAGTPTLLAEGELIVPVEEELSREWDFLHPRQRCHPGHLPVTPGLLLMSSRLSHPEAQPMHLGLC